MNSPLAYLISQYPSYSHTFILREVRGLRAIGWDIQTVSIRASDRPVAKLTPEEAEEHSKTFYVIPSGIARIALANLSMFLRHPVRYLATIVYALRLGHGGLRKLVYFAEAVAAGVWIKKRGIPHVHTHFSSTVALLMRKLFPMTVSMTIHGSDEFIDPVGFGLRQKIEACSFVVAISKYGRSQLMRFSSYEHWYKLDICRLGINASVFNRSARVRKPGPFRVITVGRLVPVKGLHILVEAIHILRTQGREVRLSLAGDGPDRPALETHVARLGLANDVVFEGWCTQDRIKALYDETDIFALASFAEGVPVVLMEAMAMEIPCVATNITGVPELITDGVDGLLVTPSDEQQLAAAIARLMDSPELCADMGRAARRKVVSDFNLEQNIQTLSEIFRRRLQLQ